MDEKELNLGGQWQQSLVTTATDSGTAAAVSERSSNTKRGKRKRNVFKAEKEGEEQRIIMGGAAAEMAGDDEWVGSETERETIRSMDF